LSCGGSWLGSLRRGRLAGSRFLLGGLFLLEEALEGLLQEVHRLRGYMVGAVVSIHGQSCGSSSLNLRTPGILTE